MRFLHTADWHLGRIFHQTHLTDDQAYVLDQIVDIARNEAVDAVLVAGDLYDRAVPPPEAVELLDSVWQRFASELNIPVIAIPGNHDSARRVAYGSRLLAKSGIHIKADFELSLQPVTVGPADVFAIPYAEPSEVRSWTGDDSVKDHTTAMQAYLKRLQPQFQPGRPRILVAHAFVAGDRVESDSERPLSVGGAGTIPAEVFEDFDYVALGHLHAPQNINHRCRYSGSPMKYSFSESKHLKSVSIVDLNTNRSVSSHTIQLNPARDTRDIKGTLDELINNAAKDPNREDYLRVILTDQGALLNAIGRLREAYPNVMQLEREFLSKPVQERDAATNRKPNQSNEVDLFESFMSEVIGHESSDTERELFLTVLQELRYEQNEIAEPTA